MQNFNDVDICQMALKNEIFLGNFKRNKNWELILYIFFLLIFNSYKVIKNKIYIVNGISEKRFAIPKGFEGVYYGIVDKNILYYRNLTTYMSNIKRLKRVKVFVEACKKYHLIRRLKIPFGYYLDYQYWKYCLCQNDLEVVLSNGHYDRLTTQLAYICRNNYLQFVIKQHGILSNTKKIPIKIPASTVYAFNNSEIEKFKENVILDHCDYKIFFQPSVNFISTLKNKMRVGIIEQPLDDMEKVIDLVLKVFEQSEIFVMLHPLSKNDYSKYLRNKNIVFRTKDKEWNLDFIIARASTLVLEYAISGYKNPIFVIDENNDLTELAEEYSNIICYPTIEDFRKVLVENSK